MEEIKEMTPEIKYVLSRIKKWEKNLKEAPNSECLEIAKRSLKRSKDELARLTNN